MQSHHRDEMLARIGYNRNAGVLCAPDDDVIEAYLKYSVVPDFIDKVDEVLIEIEGVIADLTEIKDCLESEDSENELIGLNSALSDLNHAHKNLHQTLKPYGVGDFA